MSPPDWKEVWRVVVKPVAVETRQVLRERVTKHGTCRDIRIRVTRAWVLDCGHVRREPATGKRPVRCLDCEWQANDEPEQDWPAIDWREIQPGDFA